MAADLAELTARFGHLLHGAGVPVTPERIGRLATSIWYAAPVAVPELYWLGRVTLLSDHGQIETYDRVFAQVFSGLVDVADHRSDAHAPPLPSSTQPGAPRPADGHAPNAGDSRADAAPVVADDSTGRDDDSMEPSVLAAVSVEERLRTKDFSALTEEELAALGWLMARLALAPPRRTSRRTVPHARRGRPDLRATLSRAHRHGGDPIEWVRRTPSTRPRRLVLLCDISGSMEPYSRAYLQLLHSAVGATHNEAFVFATRLTRLTRALRVSNPEQALRRAGQMAPDWSGGTRIGLAMKAFNDGYGRRGMARGAVVVIVSDGWERDAPELLGREMARLARLAHRVVWVNPRRASARYQPLVGGMAAALPHIDELVSGHSLAALDEVVRAIGR